MQNSVAQPLSNASPRAQTRDWRLIILVVALLFALLVGLLGIGGYFLLTSQRSTSWTWQSPLGAVDITRVRPDVAVLTLTGEAPTSILQEALVAGEPDSGYSVLAYSSELTDAERSGNLLLLAKAFEEAGARDLAALSYQQLQSLAALSAVLPDSVRADSTLAAAEGFIRLGMVDAARPVLAQAEALARYSALLAPVKRQEIAQKLVVLYRQAGMETQARAAEQLVREPRGLPDARLVRGPFLPTFLTELIKPQQLLEVERRRRQAAFDFLAAWDLSEGSEVEAARAALASALLEEDGLRQAVAAAEMEASPQLSAKAASVQSFIDWLSLKLMIAEGGMGFSLVPEWEAQREQVRLQLDLAYDQLLTLHGDQVAALPDPADSGFARVEVLRDQLLRGRLGLYPNFPEDGLVDRLNEAQQAVGDRLPLLIVRDPWGSGHVYRLAESFE